MNLVAVYGTLLNPYIMEMNTAPVEFEYFRKPDVISAKILDYKLELGRLANIVPSHCDYVPVGLWMVDDFGLEVLDYYEGVDGGLYDRTRIEVSYELPDGGIKHELANVYVMNHQSQFLNMCEEVSPERMEATAACIRTGYKFFGLDEHKLNRAIEEQRQKWQKNC